MSTWQDLGQRLKAYVQPWYIISMGISFLFKARPTWLGGVTRPENISARDYASGQLFQKLSSGFKAFEGSSTSVPSLVASAHGVVLELGPGVGSQLDRFDKSKIDHIYGVELNPTMVPPLLAEVEVAKLQGKYTVILGAVEDENLLASYGLKAESVDSIVCMGTLCSVEDPAQVMRWIYALLKPGGVFIFWEHCRSDNFVTRLVQEFWNPLWQFTMGGCNLNRSSGAFIRSAGDWDLGASDAKVLINPASPWSLMPRYEGRLVKRA